MQGKCSALVLRSIKYGDSSLILKTLTREEGAKTFIVSTSRKKGSPMHPGLAQPMNHLSIVYYPQSKGDLKRIKEVRRLSHFEELHFDPVKACICLFMAEILQPVFSENDPQPWLFDYLVDGLQWLDEAQRNYSNWHLQVLHKTMADLGFAPQALSSSQPVFDMQEGTYSVQEPLHSYWISGNRKLLWESLHQHPDWNEPPRLTTQQRSLLLDDLLTYYRLHINDFGKIKSLDVLREVLHS